MSPERFVAFLLRTLVAILLAASPVTDELAWAASNAAATDDSCKAALLDQDQALDDTIEGKIDGLAGGSAPDWREAPAEICEFTLDRARFIRIGQVSHPTAPPSHSPCAAPPTGPPSC